MKIQGGLFSAQLPQARLHHGPVHQNHAVDFVAFDVEFDEVVEGVANLIDPEGPQFEADDVRLAQRVASVGASLREFDGLLGGNREFVGRFQTSSA